MNKSTLSGTKPALHDLNTTEDQKLPFDINKALDIAGGYGLFQIVGVFIFFTPLCIHMSFILALPLFTAFPHYSCQWEEGGEWQECSRWDFCETDTKWRIDWENPESMHNMIIDMDLHCASNLQVGMISSLFFGSFVVGSIAFADFGDRFGRMKSFRYLFPLVLLGTFIATIAPNVWFLYLGFTLIGLGSQVRAQISFIYTVEIIVDRYVAQVTYIQYTLLTICRIIMILCVWFLTNYWRTYYWIMLGSSFLIWLPSFVFPESPKQLFATKRYDEFEQSLRTIFRVNKYLDKSLDRDALDAEIKSLKDSSMYEDNQSQVKDDIYQNFYEAAKKDTSIRNNTLILFATWFLIDFGYTVACFMTKSLNGNIFENYLFAEVADIAASVISSRVYDTYGLKKTLSISCLSSAIFGLVFLTIYDIAFFVPFLLFLMNVGVCSSYVTIFVANQQILPREFISIIMSACFVLGRVGSTFGPIVGEIAMPIPLLAFIVSNLIPGIATLKLHEKL